MCADEEADVHRLPVTAVNDHISVKQIWFSFTIAFSLYLHHHRPNLITLFSLSKQISLQKYYYSINRLPMFNSIVQFSGCEKDVFVLED